MGGSLAYSCKNTIDRPRCDSNHAFAVLKVGNSDPERKIKVEKVKREGNIFLKNTVVKSGPFGYLNKIEWFFEGQKLAYDDQEEIPITEFGTYRALMVLLKAISKRKAGVNRNL